MLSSSRVPSLLATLALLLLANVSYANPDSAWDGTWELNLAKSKFDPGPAFKSQVRTVTTEGDMQTVKISTVNAGGRTTTSESSYRLDGKEYPITGSPDFDALALKRVDNATVSGVVKHKGKVAMHTTRALSKDGKVMTVTNQGTNPAGQPMNNVMVFDRK
jgi:hypothetical protein